MTSHPYGSHESGTKFRFIVGPTGEGHVRRLVPTHKRTEEAGTGRVASLATSRQRQIEAKALRKLRLPQRNEVGGFMILGLSCGRRPRHVTSNLELSARLAVSLPASGERLSAAEVK